MKFILILSVCALSPASAFASAASAASNLGYSAAPAGWYYQAPKAPVRVGPPFRPAPRGPRSRR